MTVEDDEMSADEIPEDFELDNDPEDDIEAALNYESGRGDAWAKRAAEVFAKLGTTAQDWEVVKFADFIKRKKVKPDSPVDTTDPNTNIGPVYKTGYIPVATDYSSDYIRGIAAKGEPTKTFWWETKCNLCGQEIVYPFLIGSKKLGDKVMVVGSTCVEEHVNATYIRKRISEIMAEKVKEDFDTVKARAEQVYNDCRTVRIFMPRKFWETIIKLRRGREEMTTRKMRTRTKWLLAGIEEIKTKTGKSLEAIHQQAIDRTRRDNMTPAERDAVWNGQQELRNKYAPLKQMAYNPIPEIIEKAENGAMLTPKQIEWLEDVWKRLIGNQQNQANNNSQVK